MSPRIAAAMMRYWLPVSFVCLSSNSSMVPSPFPRRFFAAPMVTYGLAPLPHSSFETAALAASSGRGPNKRLMLRSDPKDRLSKHEWDSGTAPPYLIASGLAGEAPAPVIGRAGATHIDS